VTLLAVDNTGALTAQLENKLGYKIHVFYPVGEMFSALPEVAEDEVNRLVSEIHSATMIKVMLVLSNGKINVVPYQEKQ
jgi:L-arabinose isomerase